jgi:hypothetical protein
VARDEPQVSVGGLLDRQFKELSFECTCKSRKDNS